MFYKSRLWNYRMIFKVVVLVGFIWLLLLGVVDSRRRRRTKVMARLNGGQVAGFRPSIVGRRHTKLELINFVSKRRVPNGPDPIHNRRAGNSNRPPGRQQSAGDAPIEGRRH